MIGGDQRRRQVRARAGEVNGLDHLDVATGTGVPAHRVLLVQLVNPVVGALPGPGWWRVEGGERIRGLQVTAVATTPEPDVLRLRVDRAGDLSLYTLRLLAGPDEGYDPALATLTFTFRPGCDAGQDCRAPEPGVPGPPPPPPVDYTARDYAAFRRVLLDRLASTQPRWTGREPTDVRMALVEMSAYAADRLSYMLDAGFTEAFLGLARQRISVRRHARLVDYAMHDGCTARAWIRFAVTADVDGPLPGTRLLTGPPASPPTIVAGSEQDRALRGAGAQVFEIVDAPTRLVAAHSALRLHAWGASGAVLAAGARQATVHGAYPDLAGRVVVLADVHPGGALEPRPGSSLRHPVRVTTAVAVRDPVAGIDVTDIAWAAADALPFDLPIGEDPGGTGERAAVFGNLALADHGERMRDIAGRISSETLPPVPDEGERGGRPPSYRPRLRHGPVSRRPPVVTTGAAAAATRWEVGDTRPAVLLRRDGLDWQVRADLLGAGPLTRAVVVETDDLDRSHLRFGDGVNGRRPDPAPGGAGPAEHFTAEYAVGNGRAGNVGPETITRLVLDGDGRVAALGAVLAAVGNPVPARGGLDPEPVERVRLRAPATSHTQLRCVTEADYARRAAEHPEVQRAAARLRWTGSWYTVVLSVDRLGGGTVAEPAGSGRPLRDELRAFLADRRMTGHDIAVVDPVFVPLELTLTVCPDRGTDWPTLRARLAGLFSSRVLADGSHGLFHPDVLTFGEPVLTGPLIAAAQRVPGVVWVEIAIARLGTGEPVAVENGRILLEPPRIARLDNDPNFPDRGSVRIAVPSEVAT